MATTPDPVFIGLLVQMPAVAGGNGGVDRMAGMVTEIVDPEPEGGGVLVNVRPLTNSVSLSLGVIEVLYCAYDSEAIALGFTGLLDNVPLGCWPLDYTWA